MGERPIHDEQILEALEACRPGGNDVADPEMAHLAAAMAADEKLERLYERLQTLDARLTAAFQDVPVPEGLQPRLIERLAEAREGGVVAGDQGAAVLARPRRVSRRWLTIAAGALAAAAVLLVAAWISTISRTTAYDGPAVRAEAIEFFSEEAPAAGHLAAEESPPAGYPFSAALARDPAVRFPKMQWRRIRGFLGTSGVAYDLPGRGGFRATLYVVRVEHAVPGLFASPPSRGGPGLTTTTKHSAAAWQVGKLLYVLVVRGGPRSYQQLLDVPRGPVT